jgi:hypothetical protein
MTVVVREFLRHRRWIRRPVPIPIWVRRSPNRRTGFMTCLVIALALGFSGCATTPESGVSQEKLDCLVKQLNTSSMQNRMARTVLVSMGEKAVPRLIKEADLRATDLQDEGKSLKAMRAMRVLREIKTPRVLPVCRRILLKRYLRPTLKHDAALLNETLACVYDQFDRKEARDLYVDFMTDDSRRYMKETRDVKHWAAPRYSQRVEVDVVRGLHLMVKHGDKRAKVVLVAFLHSMAVDSMSKTYFHRLAENGFTITEQTFTERSSNIRALLGHKKEAPESPTEE